VKSSLIPFAFSGYGSKLGFELCHYFDIYHGTYQGVRNNRQMLGRFELKQLLSLYNGLVEFIEGSPIKQSDLDRICAKRATAFFLLADKEAEVHLSLRILLRIVCFMEFAVFKQ
jgi:hypothetical protein